MQIAVENKNVTKPLDIERLLQRFVICRNDDDAERARRILEDPVWTCHPDIIRAAIGCES